MQAQMTDIAAIKTFVFGGNARFTLRSKKTDTRFTFRVRVSEDGKCHFVTFLSGPDNGNDYRYLGFYREGQPYRHGSLKAKAGQEAPVARAFNFFATCLEQGRLSANLEFYHEGRCGRCARALTVPESVLTGFGPECAEMMGISQIQCDEPKLESTFGLGPYSLPDSVQGGTHLPSDPMMVHEFWRDNIT